MSLDSGPTEGASCLEPLEQSVLDSSLATRPVECVIVNVLDWEPLRNLATSYALYSRLTEGIPNLERTALGVSLESRPMEGAPCLEPLEQSVLSSLLTARPVQGVAEKVSDRKPVINPFQNINPYGRPMEGIAYPEHLATTVSLDSRFSTGMLQAKPLPTVGSCDFIGRTTSSEIQDVTLGAISARSFAGDTDGPDGWITVSQLDNTVTLRTVTGLQSSDSPDRLQTVTISDVNGNDRWKPSGRD